MEPRGKDMGRMSWETGIDIYIYIKYTVYALNIQQMTKENPPNGSGNAARGSAVTYVGMKPKAEGTHVHT